MQLFFGFQRMATLFGIMKIAGLIVVRKFQGLEKLFQCRRFHTWSQLSSGYFSSVWQLFSFSTLWLIGTQSVPLSYCYCCCCWYSFIIVEAVKMTIALAAMSTKAPLTLPSLSHSHSVAVTLSPCGSVFFFKMVVVYSCFCLFFINSRISRATFFSVVFVVVFCF